MNYGFPEPKINAEAIRVIGCFSRHIGAWFRFGVLIGGGPMISSFEGAGPVKKSCEKLEAAAWAMASDLLSEAAEAPPKRPNSGELSAPTVSLHG